MYGIKISIRNGAMMIERNFTFKFKYQRMMFREAAEHRGYKIIGTYENVNTSVDDALDECERDAQPILV